ncbi:hypothetical protein [Geovibrio ferrireducens]|uniref:hypothetical protein n=1 Tax=Geovibrio ferrireducens TaxID=46201 RepID=UPI0022470D73|nr:hypothetical protein [Geovibrio ferrireducens]
MSKFREQLEKDLGVFVGAGEFGETVNWNGAEIDGVLESVDESSGDKFAAMQINGLVTRRKKLFAAVSQFDEAPVTGLYVEVNSEHYQIENAVNDCGLYEIDLVLAEGR